MLSKWQTLFLLIMTLPIMGHVVILPIMLNVAGRDILLSIIISLPFAILYAYAIYRLRLYYPNLALSEIPVKLLGNRLGKFIVLLFIIYFLFLTILSFAALIDFVYINFLPETPILALMVWFLVFFLYAATKGFKQIALTAGILGLIGVVTGHTITLMDTKYKDWNEMFPLLEFGWGPPIWGSIILISVWIELIFLLFVPIKNIHEKRFFLIWTVAILITSLTMFSTANGTITIFGLNQAENFTYPAQEIVRLISLGFIDRFDTYGMILMTFGVYVRCSLFFRIAYELTMTEKHAKWRNRIVFSLFTLLVFFGTYYLAKEHFRIEWAINIYAYMIILFSFPFIFLFLSRMKDSNRTK